MTDVSGDLVDFLRSEADFTSVSVSFDDQNDLHEANPDGGRSYPSVVTVSEDPIVPGGGDTQFTAMDPGGGGPIQDRIWLVTVDCWGGPVSAGAYEGVDVHPDDVAGELGNIVSDTCINAAADAAPSGYEWISADPPSTANDTDPEYTHYRRQVTCRLKTTT
jgi:hypothetical protein